MQRKQKSSESSERKWQGIRRMPIHLREFVFFNRRGRDKSRRLDGIRPVCVAKFYSHLVLGKKEVMLERSRRHTACCFPKESEYRLATGTNYSPQYFVVTFPFLSPSPFLSLPPPPSPSVPPSLYVPTCLPVTVSVFLSVSVYLFVYLRTLPACISIPSHCLLTCLSSVSASESSWEKNKQTMNQTNEQKILRTNQIGNLRPAHVEWCMASCVDWIIQSDWKAGHSLQTFGYFFFSQRLETETQETTKLARTGQGIQSQTTFHSLLSWVIC